MKGDRKLIETLRNEFGEGWFGARMAHVPKATLLRLAEEGKLYISKEAYSGNHHFKISKWTTSTRRGTNTNPATT